MTSSEPRLLADGFTLLEGPRWVDGVLYVSDFFTERVLRFPEPVGGRFETVCTVPGRPSGLGVTATGDLLAVSMLGRALMRWDGRSLDRVADLSMVPGPGNDMALDAAGRCYVGNFGLRDGAGAWGRGTDLVTTELLLVDEDGGVRAVADDLVFPNGIVLSADGRILLVAETYRGRVTAFDVAVEGGLGGRRVWADFATSSSLSPPPLPPLEILAATAILPVLPDGIALDQEGALWMADAKGHGVFRIGEGGQQLDFVDTGGLAVYAVALGGPGHQTMYLCCAPPVETFDPTRVRASVLLSCEVEVPGLPRR